VTQTNPDLITDWGRHRRRRTWVRRHISLVTCVAVALAATLTVIGVKVAKSFSSASRPTAPVRTTQQIRYFGVHEPDAPYSYAGVDQFAQHVGREPNLVSYYSGWKEPFQNTFAQIASSHGATTIIYMDPTNISLAKIAAGGYDSYLISFARSVAAFGHPVVISFGHEMNGFWYSWGYRHSRPSDFIAAWRHVVTVFHRHGAHNVTWLWVVNSISSQTGPVHDWWPGSRYVTWVGIAGYYWLPDETFSYIFSRVASGIRRFTQDPILIAETGVGPFPGRSDGIKDLFAGVRAQHYLGFVWFDVHSYGGVYKGEDWRLPENSGALAAFRSALRGST
jgi:mannan endo-1,4-beta-mannosidase